MEDCPRLNKWVVNPDSSDPKQKQRIFPCQHGTLLPSPRYEKLPSDYRAPFILNLEHPPVSGPLTMVANRTASSTLASLSRYFYHQRWIWSVQSGLAPAVPITAVAQLLSTLTE